DSDKIHPAVPVDVHSMADKGVAVAFVIFELFRRFYLVFLPIGRFKPIGTCHDIYLTVLVDVTHCYPLCNKVLKKHMLLEKNLIYRDLCSARSYRFALKEKSREKD